jgi:chemotaxis protein methyltransferase CheR
MTNIDVSNIKKEEEIETIINSLKDDYLTLIGKRLGIVVHGHQIDNLTKTIYRACQHFGCTPVDYLTNLKLKDENAPEVEYLIARITIGETYFFRDRRQMEILKSNILPELIKAKKKTNNLVLRVWSAGCSSGEEIYTIAMILDELLNDEGGWVINLLATDINTQQLRKAVAGVYNEWSLRSIPAFYKQKYFHKVDNKYALAKEIKDRVNFVYLNLNDNLYPSILNNTNSQDLILCRNVLIYFEEKHIASIMKKLSTSLTEDGYIMLGASDPVRVRGTNLAINPKLGMVLTRKITQPKESVAVQESKKILDIKPKFRNDLIIHKNDKVEVINDDAKLPEFKNKIDELYNEKKWNDIISLSSGRSSDSINDVSVLMKVASAYSNIGSTNQALTIFTRCLKTDTTNKKIYFNYALALIEANKMQEAEAALRRAIYLDHTYLIAHFQLGLLLIRMNNKKDGLKSLKNALMIAKKSTAADTVEDADDMTYGRLTTVLETEMQMYE